MYHLVSVDNTSVSCFYLLKPLTRVIRICNIRSVQYGMKTVFVLAVIFLVPVTGHWRWSGVSSQKPKPTPTARPTPTQTPRPTHNCSLPLDVGQPFCAQSPQKRFFFNTSTQECKPFQFYPCGGNSNNFRDLWLCQWTCERTPDVKSGGMGSGGGWGKGGGRSGGGWNKGGGKWKCKGGKGRCGGGWNKGGGKGKCKGGKGRCGGGGTTVTVQTITMNNGNVTRSTMATMASGSKTRGGTVPTSTTVSVQTSTMNNGNVTRSTMATMASGNTTERRGNLPPPS